MQSLRGGPFAGFAMIRGCWLFSVFSLVSFVYLLKFLQCEQVYAYVILRLELVATRHLKQDLG